MPIVLILWLAIGCGTDDDQQQTIPDAASGFPWCADLGCKPWEHDRRCGAERICSCEIDGAVVRCEPPVSPMQ